MDTWNSCCYDKDDYDVTLSLLLFLIRQENIPFLLATGWKWRSSVCLRFLSVAFYLSNNLIKKHFIGQHKQFLNISTQVAYKKLTSMYNFMSKTPSRLHSWQYLQMRFKIEVKIKYGLQSTKCTIVVLVIGKCKYP